MLIVMVKSLRQSRGLMQLMGHGLLIRMGDDDAKDCIILKKNFFTIPKSKFHDIFKIKMYHHIIR